MERYCVYKHTSPSGKVYIGLTKQDPHRRWKNGLGYQSSPHFWNAIQKYGWDSFKHEILLCDLTIEDACFYESYYIALYDSTNSEKGYNEKFGGQTGAIFTETVRAKMSASMKEYIKNHPEFAEKARATFTGRKHTEEEKQKMRMAGKSHPQNLTDSWKKNIGESVKKRVLENADIKESMTKRCVENGMKKAKKVSQFYMSGELLAEYESTKAAQRETGIRSGNISKCCNGLSKSAGGYIWRYAN